MMELATTGLDIHVHGWCPACKASRTSSRTMDPRCGRCNAELVVDPQGRVHLPHDQRPWPPRPLSPFDPREL